MKFIESIKFGFKNYFNFKGQVDRSTFWFWMLFATLVVWLDGLLSAQGILALCIFVPTCALVIRRYRDAGVSLFWLLLWLIPILSAPAIVGLVFSAFLSGPGATSFMDMGVIGLGLGLAIAIAIIFVVAGPVVIVNIIFLTKPSKK